METRAAQERFPVCQLGDPHLVGWGAQTLEGSAAFLRGNEGALGPMESVSSIA
jgi:hypothetical protein